jgi:hypothetical protein
VKYILNRLRSEDIVTDAVSPNFLVRNWSVAFPEWSTKSIHDAFFASPIFPRLLSSNAVKDAIARGVKEGKFAYCGKTGVNQYDPFIFKETIAIQDIEISDDIILIKQEDAENYQRKITQPPVLSEIIIEPTNLTLKPGESYQVNPKGRDQYGEEIPLTNIQWQINGGEINKDGVLIAGDNTGSYSIMAEVNGVKTSKIFTIEKPTKPPLPPTISKIKWQGEINPQKWSQFYMKVLTKYVTSDAIDMNISVTLSLNGRFSEQMQQEMQSALQELGLNTNIQEQ